MCVPELKTMVWKHARLLDHNATGVVQVSAGMPHDKGAAMSDLTSACGTAAVERPIAPEIHDCCGHLKLASGIEVRAKA